MENIFTKAKAVYLSTGSLSIEDLKMRWKISYREAECIMIQIFNKAFDITEITKIKILTDRNLIILEQRCNNFLSEMHKNLILDVDIKIVADKKEFLYLAKILYK